MVTSGRALTGKDFDKALSIYKAMKKDLTIDLCASHGILSEDQLRRLFASGVTSYHHNIETSRRFFPHICTSHTFDDRIRTIKAAQRAGFCVCSGGIIGMGETWQDRIDMAFTLQELGIESIPINALMAIPGTGWKAALPFLPKTSCGPSPSSASLTRRQTSVLPQAGSCFLITGNRPCFTVHLLPLREICLPQAVQPSKKTWK